MSETKQNPWLIGGGGAVVGLLVGVLATNESMKGRIEQSVSTAVGPSVVAAKDQGRLLTALSERLDAIEASIGENAKALDGVTAGMSERIDGLQASLGERIDTMAGAAADQAAKVESALSGFASDQAASLKAAVGDLAANFRAEPEEAEEPVAVAAAEAPEPIEEAPAARTEAPSTESGDGGLSVGKTAIFADGAVRAFVTRLDSENGAAVLTINGARESLATGDAVVVRHSGGTCRVGLGGIADGMAQITSDCDAPMGTDSGIKPGQTATLADGALRVFFSGVIGGDARLAVNGQKTQIVAVGERLEAGDCSVSVTGISGSVVGLDGSCK